MVFLLLLLFCLLADASVCVCVCFGGLGGGRHTETNRMCSLRCVAIYLFDPARRETNRMCSLRCVGIYLFICLTQHAGRGWSERPWARVTQTWCWWNPAATGSSSNLFFFEKKSQLICPFFLAEKVPVARVDRAQWGNSVSIVCWWSTSSLLSLPHRERGRERDREREGGERGGRERGKGERGGERELAHTRIPYAPIVFKFVSNEITYACSL